LRGIGRCVHKCVHSDDFQAVHRQPAALCQRPPLRIGVRFHVALQDRLRILPAPQRAEVGQRQSLQLGGEQPPQAVPSASRLAREARERFHALPPVADQAGGHGLRRVAGDRLISVRSVVQLYPGPFCRTRRPARDYDRRRGVGQVAEVLSSKSRGVLPAATLSLYVLPRL
jgi:hypothetical protein